MNVQYWNKMNEWTLSGSLGVLVDNYTAIDNAYTINESLYVQYPAIENHKWWAREHVICIA